MPITITVPTPTGVVGPGVTVMLNSDFIGPHPSGTQWVVRTTADAEGTQVITEDRLPWVSNGAQIQIGSKSTRSGIAQRSSRKEGDPLFVQALLVTPPNVTVDSGTQAATWSGSTGLNVQIPEYASSSSGGMTAEEHGWLDTVQQFIQNTAAFGGRLGLQVLAGGILEHPDIGLMHECDSPFELVSGVDLTRPATGIGVNAFGLVLRLTSAPPGAGLKPGAVTEYQTRIAQLVSVHRAADGRSEYVTEILDFRGDQFAWLWQNAYPERISVNVTPGFTVQASWLCVTLPV